MTDARSPGDYSIRLVHKDQASCTKPEQGTFQYNRRMSLSLLTKPPGRGNISRRQRDL
jgi:hypothetical protein